MILSSISHLSLARLVRRAAARRAAVASGYSPSRRGAAVAAAALALAGPAAVAQGPLPQGGEFRVSTATTSSAISSSVARDADGDFVVVWDGGERVGPIPAPGEPGVISYGIFAQRYAASGTPVGAQFQVNTFTTGAQKRPSVAMDADGDFVVAWESYGQPRAGSGYDVYARRYAASGAPVEDPFPVNSITANNQFRPSVALDADGDFVVVWSGLGQSDSDGVYAQRYAASGARVGGEFRVNTYTTNGQGGASVAVDADGDFVVAWEGSGPGDASGTSVSGIFAQRYAASGMPVGTQFRVNTFTTGQQADASVAVDADGDFVVVWRSAVQDASTYGIYAQRYAASGAPAGGEFQVNTYTTSTQRRGAVAMDADGDFVVAWTSYGQDGSNGGVYAQRYAASGAPVGGEFRVNTYTTDSQFEPSLALDADGDIVVAWTSQRQDGVGYGVYAQRYAAGPVASEPGPSVALALALSPNPVSAGAAVRYRLAEAGRVRLAVSDVLGREVAVLWDGERGAGEHRAALDAGRLAPGVYVVRLTAGAASVVRRVTVAR